MDWMFVSCRAALTQRVCFLRQGFFTFNYAIYSYMGQLFVCLVKTMTTAMILCTVLIGICNFFSGLVIRPQFMVRTFYAFPYYISPCHYVYEGMVTALFSGNENKVQADNSSDFYEYLVGAEDCVNGTTCVGTMNDYVLWFYGGEFVKQHTIRNACILGGILVFTRLMTWVALKYIRFST